MKLILLGVAGTGVLLVAGFGVMNWALTPKSEIGNWGSLDEAWVNMREEVLLGPTDGKPPRGLRDFPIGEVLGWTQEHVHSRNLMLVVRMSRDLDLDELMDITGGFSESDVAPELPAAFTTLTARGGSKERYLETGFESGDCSVVLRELRGERLWLVEVIPREQSLRDADNQGETGG